MYSVQLHKGINLIIQFFYRLGLWHHGDKATTREMILKLFYSIYYSFFPISLILGGIKSDNRDESIFLVGCGIPHIVLCIQLFYIIWKKKEIVDLFDRVCDFSIEDHNQFNRFIGQLNSLMKFVTLFISAVFVSIFFAALVVPFLGSEKELFVNFAFPFDWKNNKIAYWMANAFFSTEVFMCSIAVLFNILIWYLLLNCSLQYDVLGHQIKDIGAIRKFESSANNRKISVADRENVFLCDMIAAIMSHQHIRMTTNETASFLSDILLIKIATGAISICGSVYCLTQIIDVTFMEYGIYICAMLYNFFDIFMVMYFGNEIKLSSDGLSYSLFECNWIDQPESSKKCMIICAELFKIPHELVFGKLYSLSLKTFSRILNGAYNMFNILQNLR